YTYQDHQFMIHPLNNPLVTEGSSLDIAYLFSENLQYLKLPNGVNFNWSIETDTFGYEQYLIHIPDSFINPNTTSETIFFEDGDKIIIRYNSPAEKTLQIGIADTYFQRKPYDYDTLPVVAEILLINTDDTSNYTSFTNPYNYNISLQLTPFDTEHSGTYKDILININLTTLQNFASNGIIDFSNIIFSVPNPAYELTLNGTGILQDSLGFTDYAEEASNRIWQFSEVEELLSSPDPTNDEYQLSLEDEPLFYNDAIEGKWLEYLKIYDENYNYYSVGITGDEYQLLYNTTTGNFTWNQGFDRFQDYWGIQIELPSMVEPNTTIYFEYSTNISWA
ncbi:hypothetical protein LCGC14_3160800, partial [marine sediment metagenome]